MKENFQAIFKDSPMPQLVLLPDVPKFTIVEVNEAYLQVTNTSERDLMGKPIFEALHTSSEEPVSGNIVKHVKEKLKLVITTKKAQNIEVQEYVTDILKSNFFPSHIYPVLNKIDEVIYLIYSPLDVAKNNFPNQKGEAKSEILFQKNIDQHFLKETLGEVLLNNLPGTFSIFNEQGKLQQWNKNLEDLTGYTSKEIGQNPLRLLSEGYGEAFIKAINKALIKGYAEVESRLLTKGGKEIPFYFVGRAITLNGKNNVIGTGLDISDLVMERTKRLSLSQILEKSRNEIYIFDEETLHFIDVNAGARQNLGYSLEELKKMTPLNLKPEYSLTDFHDLIRPLKDQTKEKIVFNTVHRRADGSHYDVEVHLQLIRQDDYKVFVAIILDVTERLQIEAQVKASLKEKEVLLTEIHHRVKNNLAIISGLLNMQSSAAENKKLKDLLKESEGRVQAMGMIHELLYHQEKFSSIDFGVYVNKLIQHVSANYQPPGLSIKTEVKSDPVYLEITTAVPAALITHELITNAYKHAFNGRTSGSVTITLKRLEDEVTLTISDNGIGMPEKTEGSSMGFTLIDGLIKQINGTIHSETENGTTFTITFPTADLSNSVPNGNAIQTHKMA